MIEQFKGQPNIEIFNKALARQLDELYEFFENLNTLRWLQTADGVQLDGIGNIVALSRSEAFTLARTANQDVPMDDETYRLYLAWKIALNTTDCTIREVYQALRMFWDTPLFYSEKIEHPATMFWSTPMLPPEHNTDVLRMIPKVKAAGVAIKFIINTQTEIEPAVLRTGGAITASVSTVTLPVAT